MAKARSTKRKTAYKRGKTFKTNQKWAIVKGKKKRIYRNRKQAEIARDKAPRRQKIVTLKRGSQTRYYLRNI